jgi:flagellar biogenesis protein FliO
VANVDTLVVSAVLILGLSIGALWMFRSWAIPRAADVAGGGRLAIAGSVLLGKRCRLYLIQVEGRAVLAGVDGTGLRGLIPLAETSEEANPKSGNQESELGGSETDGQMIVPISKHLSE